MTWTAKTFVSGDILTSAQMTAMQANFQAMADGDSGAPILSAGAVGTSAINRTALATTTASGSTTGSSYTLTGGTYSWWTISGGGGGIGFGGGNTSAGVIGLSTGFTAYIDENYVQASPPYNLGNGDVPLFIFVALNKSGGISAVQVMPDPPWAYHGPTDIRAHRFDKVSGRSWRTDNGIEREVTQEFKNSDMAAIPHPFQWAGKDHSIVLLDPFSLLVDRLSVILKESCASEVRKIITDGHVKLSPSEGFITPPGVLCALGVLL